MSTPEESDAKSTKPSPPPKKNSQEKTTANSNKQKSGSFVIGFFVFLTFVLAIAGIGAGYYVWQQIQQQLLAAEVERQALEHALSTLDENPRMQKFSHGFNQKLEQTNSQLKTIDSNLEIYNQEQKRLADIVASNSEIIGRSQSGWALKEIEHVLRMSEHRLLLDRDFEGALAGMKAADARLNSIKDARIIPIRQSIAKQKRVINEFPHPDYTGIQLKLDNLIAALKTGLVEQARELDPPAQEQSSTEKTPQAQVDEDSLGMPQPFNAAEFWEKSKQFASETSDKVKAALSDSVNITRGEQKIALFIEEQEKKRAYDFLRNKLLGAKYSVSTRDDIAYHQQLNAALAWLENNHQFSNRDDLSKDIAELNSVNLMPPLPDISEPTDLLTEYMSTLKDKK